MGEELVSVLTRWLEKESHRITYIGELSELIDSIDNLSGIVGHKALVRLLESLVGRLNPEEVWEDVEHALAVAKAAGYYKNKGYAVELEEALGRKDQKKPDLRVLINNRWIYFEVKISSMFPGEKVFLDDVLKKLKEELPRISFPWKYCLVLRYEERDAPLETPYLVEDIKSLSQEISSISRDSVEDIYVRPLAQAAIVFLKGGSPKAFEGLLAKCMDVTQLIDVSRVIRQTDRFGHYVIAIDARIPKYRGDIFVTQETQGMLIGRLSEGFEKTRLKSSLGTALGKAPQDAPYVVLVFSREIIMKRVSSVTINEIFKEARLNEISGLILDTERATDLGEKQAHRRQLFMNPQRKGQNRRIRIEITWYQGLWSLSPKLRSLSNHFFLLGTVLQSARELCMD